MEENQKSILNNSNLNNNINQNNNKISSNQANNNININSNNILQFQSMNNNSKFVNLFPPNYTNSLNNNNYNNNSNNFQGFYQQNALFNNINNNQFSQHNNYFQNEKQNKEKENKFKSKNFLKRTNYMPKNLILNQNQFQQNQFQQNQNNQNQYLQNYYSNIYNDFQNMNQMNNPENTNESQPSNNNNYCIHGNDIDSNFRNIITEIKNDANKINNDITSNKVLKVFTHIFNASIEDVAQLLTDENFFKRNCSPEIIDNIQFPKSSFKKIGESFVHLRWKQFYNVKLIVINQHWCKKHISYTLKTVEMEPVNIGSMEINLKYYYNTCQNNTLYISEFILDKGILSEVFKEELFDHDLNKLCINCEKVLRERKKEKSHISSLIINSSKEKVWNYITNLNKKIYINYMNKYDLYYIYKDEINNLNNKSPKKEIKDDDNNNHHMQKGDAILIKKSKDEIFSKLIIDEINEEKDNNEIVLICKKEENQNKNENNDDKEKEKESENINNKENIEVLNQKINISIKEITKDICFLEYKHIWEDYVNVNKIDTLNFLKIHSLKKFKELFSVNNNENNKNKKKSDNSVISIFNLLCPIEL